VIVRFLIAPWAPGLCWTTRAAGEAAFLVLPAAMTWLAVRASDSVAREMGVEDPGCIVADEWAGLWIALWPLRWEIVRAHGWACLALLALPFLFFRLFDIWKPWPIRQIQILPGGEGIVADDVVAGFFAIPCVMLSVAPLQKWMCFIQGLAQASR
jgi:phosphatidylglycerophosphatase A